MADLALGYSRAALDFVVNKVQTAIKEEEEQWQTVQRDLEFITDEFEMMQSFLNTADGERLKSLVVRTWVQQVRILSYDVEDSIEFVLQLDFGKRPWWLRLLPSWMKKAPEAPVDEAVAEITQLKARVVDVSNRNTRYNLVTDSSAKPAAFRGLGGSYLSILSDARDINTCLTMHDKSLRAICVLCEAVGDPGALSFIKSIYERVNRSHPCRHAWVKLMHPFNPHEFIRSLLAQFLRSSSEADEDDKILGVELLKMEEIQLMDKFVQQVNKHRYFIVLEGVSSVQDWDAIKAYLPDRMNRSRIIVWTHRLEVATLCTGAPYRTFVIRESSPDHPSYVFYHEDSSSSDEAARGEVKASPWPDGRHREAHELLGMVTDKRWGRQRDGECRRVVVCGPPDAGTTALVRAVYDHVLQESSAAAGGFAQQAWANVMTYGRRWFDEADDDQQHDLAHVILSELTKSTWNKGDQLVTTCQLVLRQRTTLLVLDGVWSEYQWRRINDGLLKCEMKPDSCVVVITPDEEDAERIAGWSHRHVLRVKPLAAEDTEAKEEKAASVVRLHGRDMERDELLKMVKDTNSRCVAVWGPPGVGKTVLVRAVYDHVQGLDEEVFRQQAWANVPDPLVDVAGVSRDICSGMKKVRHNTYMVKDSYDDITACRTMLYYSQGRTLLVFDGVRSKEDWNRITTNVTSAKNVGTTVIVITEDKSVAAYCAGRSDMDHMLRVNPLGPAAALSLFRERAPFYDKENIFFEGWRPLSSKCGGIPKFIVTIAYGYFRSGNLEKCVKEMRLLNDNFIHQLQNTPEYDCLKHWLTCLHSKFDGSPTVLKKCIFYLSLFSRDNNIRQKRLVRRWIAEGYCRSTDSKEEAEDLIGKVRDLCLFQPWETVVPLPSAMRKTTCPVHTSFLDYIISRQMEEKTFLPLEISVLDGRCSSPTTGVGQHLAIGSDWTRDKAAYTRLDFSRLRSLTASGEWEPFFIHQKMRVLRVLDLEGAYNLKDGDLDEIDQLMPRLKFLSLRGCKTISCLPDSLGDLMLLETLDIRHTDITVLPKTITKLHKLQHIRAGPAPAVPTQQDEPRPRQSWWSTLSASARACLSTSPGGNHGGVEVPGGMGSMKALHTLGVVDVDMAGGKAFLAELREKNKNMKKKNENKIKNNKKKKKKVVESHPLRNLSLCGLNWSQHLLDCITSLDQLESLSLRAEKLQVEHFNLPPNLVKFSLDLAGTLSQAVIEAIKDHGKLQTLRLHAQKVEGDTVCFIAATKSGELDGGGSFSEVKVLQISCNSSFGVMFSQHAMQKLALLKVHCSSGSPSEISGLNQLGALKQVWLTGSCDDTLKKALEEQLSEHKNKPDLNMEE